MFTEKTDGWTDEQKNPFKETVSNTEWHQFGQTFHTYYRLCMCNHKPVGNSCSGHDDMVSIQHFNVSPTSHPFSHSSHTGLIRLLNITSAMWGFGAQVAWQNKHLEHTIVIIYVYMDRMPLALQGYVLLCHMCPNEYVLLHHKIRLFSLYK